MNFSFMATTPKKKKVSPTSPWAKWSPKQKNDFVKYRLQHNPDSIKMAKAAGIHRSTAWKQKKMKAKGVVLGELKRGRPPLWCADMEARFLNHLDRRQRSQNTMNRTEVYALIRQMVKVRQVYLARLRSKKGPLTKKPKVKKFKPVSVRFLQLIVKRLCQPAVCGQTKSEARIQNEADLRNAVSLAAVWKAASKDVHPSQMCNHDSLGIRCFEASPPPKRKICSLLSIFHDCLHAIQHVCSFQIDFHFPFPLRRAHALGLPVTRKSGKQCKDRSVMSIHLLTNAQGLVGPVHVVIHDSGMTKDECETVPVPGLHPYPTSTGNLVFTKTNKGNTSSVLFMLGEYMAEMKRLSQRNVLGPNPRRILIMDGEYVQFTTVTVPILFSRSHSPLTRMMRRLWICSTAAIAGV